MSDPYRVVPRRLLSSESGEIDGDFGLLAAVFMAGLYFMHVGVTHFYTAFGSVLSGLIR